MAADQRTVGCVLVQCRETSFGVMDVVLAVGERFACKGVAWMVEHSLKRLLNLFPGDAFQESQSGEAVQLLYFWSVREGPSKAAKRVFVHWR